MLPLSFLKQYFTLLCAVSYCHGTTLQSWLSKISDPKFECPTSGESVSSSALIVEAISCEEPGAIFKYNYKSSERGNKKHKHATFHGNASLIFGSYGSSEKLNYGLKNKKCLKVSFNDVAKITGTFIDDKLEGPVVIFFNSQDYLKGFADKGKMHGLQRTFDKDNNLISILGSQGEPVITFGLNRTLIMASQSYQFGDKCLLTQDFESYFECYNVDGDFFANCQEIGSLANYQIDGCTISKIKDDDCEGAVQDKFNMMLSLSTKSFKSQKKLSFVCDKARPNEIRSDLTKWIQSASESMLFWDQFSTAEFDALNLNNPILDITFPDIQGRFGFEEKPIAIFSTGGKLLHQGSMVNGRIEATIDPSVASHPGWRTRLSICLDAKIILQKHMSNRHAKINLKMQFDKDGMHLGDAQMCPHLVQGMLKNGHLHGLVQIFGVTSIEKRDSCSNEVQRGLSYVGRYEDGIPVGPSWKGLIGGAWLHGNVNANGEFTGPDISYIYPDLELAMIGHFDSGTMVSGKAAEILSYVCNQDGIPVLELSEPLGPTYHFQRPTSTTFGDQPHLLDPLDAKYLYLNKSAQFPDADANEGAFAARHIAKATVYSLYSGLIFDSDELKAFDENLHKSTNDPLTLERAYMYTGNIAGCKLTLMLPPELESMADYKGTLGHKVNHKFEPNSAFIMLETPRFGVTIALMTDVDVIQDDELFTNYGYEPEYAPRWYIDLFIQFASDEHHFVDQKLLKRFIDAKNSRIDINRITQAN